MAKMCLLSGFKVALMGGEGLVQLFGGVASVLIDKV
jgi:hypothetical protein